MLGLGRVFLVERENDCWEGLLLAPGDKSAIYLGKLAGSLALMFVVEAMVLALFACSSTSTSAASCPRWSW
jgi:heme exporter protein B